MYGIRRIRGIPVQENTSNRKLSNGNNETLMSMMAMKGVANTNMAFLLFSILKR